MTPIMFAYSKMGQTTRARSFKSGDVQFFCLLHFVDVSALRMFIVCFALTMVYFDVL